MFYITRKSLTTTLQLCNVKFKQQITSQPNYANMTHGLMEIMELHFIAQGNQVQHRFIQTDTLQKISNDFNFTERLQMPSNQVLLRKFTRISFADPVFSVSSLLRITPVSLIVVCEHAVMQSPLSRHFCNWVAI